jgi:uncharacterized protein (TIGR02118 family)
MIRVSLLYPQTKESHFSMDYFLTKHIPLLIKLMQHTGLSRIHIDEGVGCGVPGLPAPFAAIGYLTFNTMADLRRGFETHRSEIMGDVANFTNVQPLIQVSRILSKVDPC